MEFIKNMTNGINSVFFAIFVLAIIVVIMVKLYRTKVAAVKYKHEMQKDFNKYVAPLKRQLEIIRSDFVLGKINKEEELKMCKPILEKIEAFECKYLLCYE